MPELLSLEETAKELRLSIYTIRAWVFQKRLPVVRLGRRVLLQRSDVEDLVRRHLDGAKQEL